MIAKVRFFDSVISMESHGDWIDLRAAEDVVMDKGDLKAIPLGLAIELPKGYEAIVAPRSSTAKNFGIICANSIGVIDNDYCGNDDQWHFLALAIRNTKIHKGDRICQFRVIENQPNVDFKVVDELSGKNRGGFGSTGKK